MEQQFARVRDIDQIKVNSIIARSTMVNILSVVEDSHHTTLFTNVNLKPI